MNIVDIVQGNSSIVLGLPHTGTFVPDEILANLNACGTGLDDTDWHVHQLYDGLMPEMTTVRATFHRYVVDANRDPSGQSLYPGQNTTGLVPLTDFDGHDIWAQAPTDQVVEIRRKKFHAAYHETLANELARVRSIHGVAILFDCHSIRSRIPFLFENTLPDFNIGTNSGATCGPAIETAVACICDAAQGYTSTLNGRFKGGWTTRHYGQPASGIHAIQMELAQSTYLKSEAAPWQYDVKKAAKLRPHLTNILTTMAEMAPTIGAQS